MSAGACLLELKGEILDIREMDISFLEDLEVRLSELKKLYAVDANTPKDVARQKAKSLKEEVTKLQEDFAADTQYNSARIMADHIKQGKKWSKIWEPTSTKKSLENLLAAIEGDNGLSTVMDTVLIKYKRKLYAPLKELDPSGKHGTLEKALYSQEYDEAIYKIIQHRADKMDLPADLAENKAALALADVVKGFNDYVYTTQRRAGIDLKYRRNRVTKRRYSADAIQEFDRINGDDAYINHMYDEVLDHEATFSKGLMELPEVERRAAALAILKQHREAVLDKARGFDIDPTSPKNYLHKLKGRKFSFKDGSVEYKFNQDFSGGKSLAENLQNSLLENARSTATVQEWGTFANKSIQDVEARLLKSSDMDKGARDKLRSKIQKARINALEPISAPSHWARTSIKVMRSLETLKLGSSVMTAMYDVNSTALHYSRVTGRSQFTAYYKSIKQFAEVASLSTAQRHRMANRVGVSVYVNDLASYHGGDGADFDTGMAMLDKYTMNYAKLTGIPLQTEISKVTNAMLHIEAIDWLAQGHANKKIDGLSALQMKKFDILPEELDIINNFRNKADLGEHKMLTPDDILDVDKIPNEAFDADIDTALRKREAMAQKMNNWVNSFVRKGTPTPDAKSKRQLGKVRVDQETSNEMQLADISSLVLQFKETAWKILTDNREAFEEIYQVKGVKGAAQAGSEYLTLGFISYLAIDGLKAAILNREPPWERLADKKQMKAAWMDYLNKSSAIPLISDAFDQGTSSYIGQDLTKFLAGPILGTASDVGATIGGKMTARDFASRHLLPSSWIPAKSLQNWTMQNEAISGRKIHKWKK